MGIRSFIEIGCTSKEVLSKISNIQKILTSTEADLKCVEPENIHVTLKFLGDLNETHVEEVKQIVEHTCFAPFEIGLKGIGVFPKLNRPRTIWVGIEKGMLELTNIFRKLDKELVSIGFEAEKRSFHPHLTICRVKSNRNRQQLIKTLIDIENTEFGEQKVNSITLKKSVLTSRGPIYTTLAESQH